MMNRLEINEVLLEHAWKYFEVHSDQRIKIFNFYLVIMAASATALAYVFQNKNLSSLGVALGLFIIFISFIFWKLDQRTSFLIKQAENVLKNLEKEYDSKYYLFSNENLNFSNHNQNKNFFTKSRSYRVLFNFTFSFTAALGSFCIIFSIIKLVGFTFCNIN